MSRRTLAVLLAMGLQATVKSAPSHSAAHPPVHMARLTPPLPMLPSIARVRLELAKDRFVVIEDVSLPRGDWTSGSLDFYVAFGSPGTPAAIDARLMESVNGGEAPAGDEGEPVSLETAVRCPPFAYPLLGNTRMAGVVARVRESALRRVYAKAPGATLRIRSLLQQPAGEVDSRDAVIRLGSSAGMPLTLGRIQLVSVDTSVQLTRAEARLCGPEADPWPLSVSIAPKHDPTGDTPPDAPIPPQLAVRHGSDDLCIRWWMAH